MQPPICEICFKRFDPDVEGDLVFFKETEKGREFDRHVREENISGHPPDAVWYCGEHVGEAKMLKHITADEARTILKRRFEASLISAFDGRPREKNLRS
jgi:hypothetical protein